MSKKAVLPFSIPRLVRVTAQEITDPAERAALDRLRKRRKRKPTQQGKKAVSRLRIGRLQRVIAEEITDLAERAALDKLRRRRKRKPPRQE